MVLTGPDLSHYQGPSVDFPAIARGGHAFVILKATEGTGYVDPEWEANRARAHAAGLYVGAYHFSRATDPVAEANYFAAAVGTLRPKEWLNTDEEVYSSNPPAWVSAFDDRASALLGAIPTTYLNQWARDQWNWAPVAQRGSALWLARYDGVYSDSPGGPGVWPRVSMEQYTDKGVCPGVPGVCDMNVFYGTEADLAALGSPNPAGADMTPQEHAQLQAVNDALASLVVKVSNPKTGLFDQVVSLRSQVSDLAAAVAKIQAGGATIDYAQLAKAVNDDAAKRLAS